MNILLNLSVAFMLLMPGIAFGQDEKQIEPYDGRCESPMPPEALASLLDKVIEDNSGSVTLTLVRHPKPSTQPADARTAWVCMADGKPIWVVSNELQTTASTKSGITSRALQLARKFVAKNDEFKGKADAELRHGDWKPAKEKLRPAYQAKHFGYQITEIKLLDREKESWKITFEPLKKSLGGEIWVYAKGNVVSAEFGK